MTQLAKIETDGIVSVKTRSILSRLKAEGE
jgi:hypothetical protein